MGCAAALIGTSFGMLLFGMLFFAVFDFVISFLTSSLANTIAQDGIDNDKDPLGSGRPSLR